MTTDDTRDFLDNLRRSRKLARETGHYYIVVRESDGATLARAIPPREALNMFEASANPAVRWDVGGWKAAR